MKTKFSALALLFVVPFLGSLPALGGTAPAAESTPLGFFVTTEAPLAESPYAPSDPVFDWGKSAGAGWAWSASDDVAGHPSLAADLMDGGAGGLSVDQLVDSLEAPALADECELGEPVGRPEALASVGVDEMRPVYDISGIPHPLMAGLAALVGLVLVARREDRAEERFD